jgi:hypothetical protein
MRVNERKGRQPWIYPGTPRRRFHPLGVNCIVPVLRRGSHGFAGLAPHFGRSFYSRSTALCPGSKDFPNQPLGLTAHLQPRKYKRINVRCQIDSLKKYIHPIGDALACALFNHRFRLPSTDPTSQEVPNLPIIAHPALMNPYHIDYNSLKLKHDRWSQWSWSTIGLPSIPNLPTHAFPICSPAPPPALYPYPPTQLNSSPHRHLGV